MIVVLDNIRSMYDKETLNVSVAFGIVIFHLVW